LKIVPTCDGASALGLSAFGGIAASPRVFLALYAVGALLVMWFCAWLVDLAAPRSDLKGKILFLLFVCAATAIFVAVLEHRRIRRLLTSNDKLVAIRDDL
jgi:hypothetical protein